MKAVDMGEVFVVHSGEPWGHSQPPCSRQMISFLEKNEGLVTWVQVLTTPTRLSRGQGLMEFSPRAGPCRTSIR